MKWHIVLEIRFHGDPDSVEAALDSIMEQLVDADVEVPAIGAALLEGAAEVEFLVEAGSLEEAHQRARHIAEEVVELPLESELIGESTRRAELVPA